MANEGWRMEKISATIGEIVDYWARVEDECGLAVDWAEAHELCWRCGYKTKLERCHIVPASLGGAATPDNLVLLCRRCHREAPNHQNPEFMWIWLRATGVPLYGTYWTIRGWEEFQIMFGRMPLDWIAGLGADASALRDEFYDELGREFEKTTVHFGEGRLNPSTIACVIAEVERILAARYGVVLPPATRIRDGLMGITKIARAADGLWSIPRLE